MVASLLGPSDEEDVESFLRRDPYLHLYELGDLDPLFRPHTDWYGLRSQSGLQAVMLVYRATDPPALLALTPGPNLALRELIRQIRPKLAPRLQVHITPSLEHALRPHFRLRHVVQHLKMSLTRPDRLTRRTNDGVIVLTQADGPDLQCLYAVAYPDNAYDASLLATGWFRGLRLEGRLVSAAGVHVYSAQYRVAAIGNVATLPQFRGRGFAGAVVARLCQDLLHTVDYVGLNVRADNSAALACYQRLGFETTHRYVELLAEREP